MASGKEIQLYSDIGKSQPVYPKTNAKCVFYDDGTRLDRMIAAARPRNLLINSDFTNPVNRNGVTDFAATGYHIDGWQASANRGTTKITANGIEVTNTATSGLYYCAQYVQDTKGILGKTVTAVAYLANGEMAITSFVFPSEDVTANTQLAEVFFENGCSVRLHKMRLYQSLFFQFVIPVGLSITAKHAAVYEGEYTIDTLPEYQPKGYEQELLICNQYDPTTGEYIGLRKFGQPRNLLDNSDFRNPVNQRGKTEYSETGSVYTIDMWRKDAATAVTVSDGYIIVSGNNNGFHQALPEEVLKRISGKTCTFAARIKAKSTGSTFQLGIGAGGGYTLFNAPVEWTTVIVHKQYDYTNYPSRNNFVMRATGDVCIEWAAIYEGAYSIDTLPEYQPKGKQVEALNCGAIPGPIDLLWQNASPTSEFAAQTVAVDLSLYSWCAIETYHSTTEVASTVDFMPVKEGVQYAVDVVDSSDNTARRPFTISKTGIVFDGAKRSGSNTTKYVIPVRIYGVKG